MCKIPARPLGVRRRVEEEQVGCLPVAGGSDPQRSPPRSPHGRDTGCRRLCIHLQLVHGREHGLTVDLPAGGHSVQPQGREVDGLEQLLGCPRWQGPPYPGCRGLDSEPGSRGMEPPVCQMMAPHQHPPGSSGLGARSAPGASLWRPPNLSEPQSPPPWNGVVRQHPCAGWGGSVD